MHTHDNADTYEHMHTHGAGQTRWCLYIYSTPEAMAEVTKWVVWANAALDPILFLENDRGQVILASLYRARALSRSLALALALALALSTSLSL